MSPLPNPNSNTNPTPSLQPHHLVQQTYDKIAPTYLTWTLSKPTPRLNYLEKMFSHIPTLPSASVLELGCGAGVPGTQVLSSRCGSVIANDISGVQIELARLHLDGSGSGSGNGNVDFRRGDMMDLVFEEERFDCVVGFYSIIHLPREEQVVLFRRIYGWLKPGGVMLCNLGGKDIPGLVAEDWLGGRMFWSSFDGETYLRLVREVGFGVVESEVLEDDEDGRMVPFLWILGVKK